MNRREFLSLLAAGAATGAVADCMESSGAAGSAGALERPVDFEGRLVGERFGPCHRLRDGKLGLPPLGAPDADEPLREVIVIGAGLSGLAAGWALQRSGIEDFVVLERSGVIGGVAQGGSVAGQPCPWGAHYIGLPDPDSPLILRLLTDLGVIDDFTADHRPIVASEFRMQKPDANLYHGRTHSVGFYPWALASRRDLAQYYAFRRDMYRWSRWRDSLGRPAFQLPLVYATDAEEVTVLDGITLADYVYGKGWDSPLLHQYLDNRMTDEYGCLTDEISAYVGILFWAGDAGEQQAPQGSKRLAPAISWPQGNAFLARGLARRLPAGVVRTDAWVVSVRNHAGEVHATVLDPDRGTTRVYRGRHCIFAAPKLRAELLIPELEEAGRGAHRRLEYTPWLVANLILSSCPEHDAGSLAWDNLIHRSWSLGFINGHHFEAPGKDSEQAFVLTFYACFSGGMREPARRDLLELDWATWARLITAELERALPKVRPQISRMDIRRWGHAMVRPAPGLLWGGTREALRRPLGNIHFAGNDAGVLPLYEEAVYQGVDAAETVLARLGRPHRSLIEPDRERLD